jgi:hypothetical protein
MGGNSTVAELAAGKLVGCLSGCGSGRDSWAVPGVVDSDGDPYFGGLDWSVGGLDEAGAWRD